MAKVFEHCLLYICSHVCGGGTRQETERSRSASGCASRSNRQPHASGGMPCLLSHDAMRWHGTKYSPSKRKHTSAERFRLIHALASSPTVVSPSPALNAISSHSE